MFLRAPWLVHTQLYLSPAPHAVCHFAHISEARHRAQAPSCLCCWGHHCGWGCVVRYEDSDQMSTRFPYVYRGRLSISSRCPCGMLARTLSLTPPAALTNEERHFLAPGLMRQKWPHPPLCPSADAGYLLSDSQYLMRVTGSFGSSTVFRGSGSF